MINVMFRRQGENLPSCLSVHIEGTPKYTKHYFIWNIKMKQYKQYSGELCWHFNSESEFFMSHQVKVWSL